MQISELDVTDEAEFDEFYEVYDTANRHSRSHSTNWAKPELRAAYRAPSTAHTRRAWLGRIDGAVVAAGVLETPLRDNTELAELDCLVAPEHRRRGYGRLLAGQLRDQAQRVGRTLAISWVFGGELDVAGQLVETSPGARFCAAIGLQERNTDVHRMLDLPVYPELLDSLAAEAAPHHAQYSLISWTDPCPDQHRAAYCALKEAMIAEAPLGDLQFEPECWDEQRLREAEAELIAMGRTRLVVAAATGDGSIVAHNEVLHAAHDPGRLYNWDTLVLPGHRGRRLGLAMKVANLSRVQHLHPRGRELHTHNAAQNAPMAAVNDQLGFRPVDLVGEWQVELAALSV